MAYEDIYSRYNNLFNSQVTGLRQKNQRTIQGYNDQQSQIGNQYADLVNSLNLRKKQTQTQYDTAKNDLTNKYSNLINGYNAQKTDTQNKYKNLYTQLDQQNTDAGTKVYNDRNNVDIGVNQNLDRVREIMARNGWLGGGENLQAQMQSNSDRMNGMGVAENNYASTLRQVLNDRNNYQAQEQGTYNEIANNISNAQTSQTSDLNNLESTTQNTYADLDNQISSADREKAQKLAAIIQAIQDSNNNESSSETALRQQLDAQAQQEISQLQEAERQRQWQAQQEAAARAAQLAAADAARRAQVDAENRAREWDTNPNNPDYSLKQQQLQDNQMNKVISQLDGLYTYDGYKLDEKTGEKIPIGKQVSNITALENAILNLGLDDNSTKALYARYGIPIPQAPAITRGLTTRESRMAGW